MGNTFYIVWTTMTACLTMSTAAVLAFSILTDHWESIEYSPDKLAKISEKHNLTIKDYFGDQRIHIVNRIASQESNGSHEILLKMHGGLWWVCYDLTEAEHNNISEVFSDSFFHPLCLNHREETQKFAEKSVNTQSSRQMRLLNLCISSSLVCLILLGVCLLVFWAGLAKKQVPPVLVVSVIFVLSALFAIFSLFFMQEKRDPVVNVSFLDVYTSKIWRDSRVFKTSWSYYLGWLGVGGCFLSSISVYVLTRLMRSTLPYLV